MAKRRVLGMEFAKRKVRTAPYGGGSAYRKKPGPKPKLSSELPFLATRRRYKSRASSRASFSDIIGVIVGLAILYAWLTS